MAAVSSSHPRAAAPLSSTLTSPSRQARRPPAPTTRPSPSPMTVATTAVTPPSTPARGRMTSPTQRRGSFTLAALAADEGSLSPGWESPRPAPAPPTSAPQSACGSYFAARNHRAKAPSEPLLAMAAFQLPERNLEFSPIQGPWNWRNPGEFAAAAAATGEGATDAAPWRWRRPGYFAAAAAASAGHGDSGPSSSQQSSLSHTRTISDASTANLSQAPFIQPRDESLGCLARHARSKAKAKAKGKARMEEDTTKSALEFAIRTSRSPPRASTSREANGPAMETPAPQIEHLPAEVWQPLNAPGPSSPVSSPVKPRRRPILPAAYLHQTPNPLLECRNYGDLLRKASGDNVLPGRAQTGSPHVRFASESAAATLQSPRSIKLPRPPADRPQSSAPSTASSDKPTLPPSLIPARDSEMSLIMAAARHSKRKHSFHAESTESTQHTATPPSTMLDEVDGAPSESSPAAGIAFPAPSAGAGGADGQFVWARVPVGGSVHLPSTTTATTWSQPKPSRSVPDFRHHQGRAQGRSVSIANGTLPGSPVPDIGASPKHAPPHTPSHFKGRMGHLRHRARTLSRSRKISHDGTEGDDESLFGCRTAASEDSPPPPEPLPLPGGYGDEGTQRPEMPGAKDSPGLVSPPQDLNRHQAGCTPITAKDGIRHFWEATKHLASARLTTARSHTTLLEPARLPSEERETRSSNARSLRPLGAVHSLSDYGHPRDGNKRDTYVFSPEAELPPRTRPPVPVEKDTVLPRVIARHEQILPQRQEAAEEPSSDVDAAPRAMSMRHSRANTIDADTESTITRETWRVDTNSVAGSPWVPIKALLEPVQLTQVVEVNDDAESERGEYPAPDSGVSFNPTFPATEKSFEAARYSRTPRRSSPLRHSTSEADLMYYYPTAGPDGEIADDEVSLPSNEPRSVASIPDVSALLAVHKKKRISSSHASNYESRVSSAHASGLGSRVSSGLESWDELAFLADEIHSRLSDSPVDSPAAGEHPGARSHDSLTSRAKGHLYSASIGGSTFDGDVAWEGDYSGAVGSVSDSHSNVGDVGYSPVIEDHPYRYASQPLPATNAPSSTGQHSPSHAAQQFRFPRPPNGANLGADQRKVAPGPSTAISQPLASTTTTAALTSGMAAAHAQSPSLSSVSSAATNLSRFGFPSILDETQAPRKDGGQASMSEEPSSAQADVAAAPRRSYEASRVPLAPQTRHSKNQLSDNSIMSSVSGSASRSSRQYLRGPSWAPTQSQPGSEPIGAQATGMSTRSHRQSKSIESLASSFATGHTEYSSNFLHGLRSHAAENAKGVKSDADATAVGAGAGLTAPGLAAPEAASVGLGVSVPAEGSGSGQSFLPANAGDEDVQLAHPPLTSSVSMPAVLTGASDAAAEQGASNGNGNGKQVPARAGHGHRRLKSSIDLLERAAMGTISESS